MELEEEKPKVSAKLVRIPLIVHTTLKRDSNFALQIEHLQVRRTSIHMPKDMLSIDPETIGEYIRDVYPNAKSFIIQYEDKDGEAIPFCAQIFLSGKPRDRRLPERI